MSFFRRLAVSKVEAVVIAGILLVVVALLLPNVEQGVSDARRVQCRNNLKRIAMALHQYHGEYGSFPPAVTAGPDGKPWHSWRVFLLPYLGADATGHQRVPFAERYRLGEPWDSPNNLAAVTESPVPLVFGCPADRTGYNDKTTSYIAVVGTGTMWLPRGSGSIEEAADGTGVTVHVVERVGSGIPWTEPRDVELGSFPFEMRRLTAGPRAGDAEDRAEGSAARPVRSHGHVALVDGSARFVADDTSPETVKSLLLKNDGGPGEVP